MSVFNFEAELLFRILLDMMVFVSTRFATGPRALGFLPSRVARPALASLKFAHPCAHACGAGIGRIKALLDWPPSIAALISALVERLEPEILLNSPRAGKRSINFLNFSQKLQCFGQRFGGWA